MKYDIYIYSFSIFYVLNMKRDMRDNVLYKYNYYYNYTQLIKKWGKYYFTSSSSSSSNNI